MSNVLVISEKIPPAFLLRVLCALLLLFFNLCKEAAGSWIVGLPVPLSVGELAEFRLDLRCAGNPLTCNCLDPVKVVAEQRCLEHLTAQRILGWIEERAIPLVVPFIWGRTASQEGHWEVFTCSQTITVHRCIQDREVVELPDPEYHVLCVWDVQFLSRPHGEWSTSSFSCLLEVRIGLSLNEALYGHECLLWSVEVSDYTIDLLVLWICHIFYIAVTYGGPTILPNVGYIVFPIATL